MPGHLSVPLVYVLNRILGFHLQCDRFGATVGGAGSTVVAGGRFARQRLHKDLHRGGRRWRGAGKAGGERERR